MRDVIVNIVVVLIIFGTGYIAGLMHDKFSVLWRDINEMSFCELTEEEKLMVCPKGRVMEKLTAGGTAVFYICDENEMYLEAAGLTDKSQEYIKYMSSDVRAIGGSFKKVCDNKQGPVYHIKKVADERAAR